MWIAKKSFSRELDLCLFKHQESLVIVLCFYNEVKRAVNSLIMRFACKKIDQFLFILKNKKIKTHLCFC